MKRSEKVFYGVAALGVLIVCGFGVLYGVTTQRRNAAREGLSVPDSLAFYRDLQTKTVEPSPAEKPRSPHSPRERMAAFDQLFKDTAFTNNDAEWGELIGDIGRYPSDWTDEMRESLRKLVAAIEPYMQRIRDLAREDGPIYPLDFSKGHAMELPHLAPLRHSARLLAADALVAAESGDIGRGVDDIDAVLGLSDALQGEPLLISQLVRIAVAGIAFNSMRLLPESGLAPEYYERLMAHLAVADHREAFASGFAGEAAIMEVFFNDPEGIQLMSNSGDPIELGLVRLYASPLAAPLRNSDEAATLEILQQIQAAGALPFYEARPEIDRVDERIDSLSFLQPISAMMLPALGRAMQAQARLEAMLDLAQLGLATEQFRDATGNLPPALGVVQEYLPGALPLDPFTGDPYVYRPTDPGFLLYSVDQNLTDDGGRHDPGDADIVWRGVEEE